MGSGGEYLDLLRRAQAGRITAAEFSHSFAVYHESDTRFPSLGVMIVCRFPHLMLRNAPQRDWLRQAAALIFMDRNLRQQFNLITDPICNYTNETARDVLLANSDFHGVIIRAMLMMLGLRKAENWERALGFDDELSLEFALEGGTHALGRIILDHLKEGPVADIRLLMGGDPDGTYFDGANLIQALGEFAPAAATVCATRVPELFLFRGRCFDLKEEDLNVIFLLICEAEGYQLRPEQKEELLRGDFLTEYAAKRFRQCWRM